MIWIRLERTLKKWIKKRLEEGSSKEAIKLQLVQAIDRELYWDEEAGEE